jgi:hypothetical protein
MTQSFDLPPLRRRLAYQGARMGEAAASVAPASPVAPVVISQEQRGAEVARLTRLEGRLRSELTEVLAALRRLERSERHSQLTEEEASQLQTLRSEESRLHTELRTTSTDLRVARVGSG